MAVDIHLADGGTMTFPDQATAEAWLEEQRANQEAKAQQVQARNENIRQAVAKIIAIRDAAEADQATAENLRQQALAMSDQLATQATQIAAFIPSATYKATEMAAVRDQLALLTQRQKTIADALANSYAYRKANDQSTVTIYNALLWLAEKVVDDLPPDPADPDGTLNQ